MQLSDFLPVLFRALDANEVHFCILRNYDSFPANNIGIDVDFLIYPGTLPRVIQAIRSIPGIQIVGYMRRSYVASLFVEGVTSIAESRSLQLDFLSSLSWKEMPYLPTSQVLQSAISHSADNLTFLVPSPAHEAISTLLTSLIYCGWAKEKYLLKVQQAFAGNTPGIIAALQPQFGKRTATRLVTAVIGGDLYRIHSCARPLQVALILRSLLHRPFRSLMGIFRYYQREIAVRFSPSNVTTVCIIGLGGYNKTAVIETLMPMLHQVAKSIVRLHFNLRMPSVRESSKVCASSDPQVQTSCGFLGSMISIVLWMLEAWMRQFIGKKNNTLHIFDNYYHDIYIDTERNVYTGPMCFARLVGRLIPSPDLWIFLDPDAERMSPSNQHASSVKMVAKCEDLRAFVEVTEKCIILDAGKPIASVAESAYAAIIEALAQRTDRKLAHDF